MNTGSIRLFVDSELALDVELGTNALQAHYLTSVMRRTVGDLVTLFNGRDGEWLARIRATRRDQVRLVAESQLRAQANRPPMALAFAPLKRDATDLVVGKATELGATSIHPVITAHSNTQRVNLERYRAITIEAAEQCERLDLPTLHAPVPLVQFLYQWDSAKNLLLCAERSNVPKITELRLASPAAGLIVGPEGGFASTELELMRRYTFLNLVSLGPLVLRAETAAIAGMALLQSQLG